MKIKSKIRGGRTGCRAGCGGPRQIEDIALV